MPMWTIEITAERTVYQDFEVEAETREKAEELALEEARNDEYGWDSGDGASGFQNHQVTAVKEEEPEDEDEDD